MLLRILDRLQRTATRLLVCLLLEEAILKALFRKRELQLPKPSSIELDGPPLREKPSPKWKQILAEKESQGIQVEPVHHRKPIDPDWVCAACGAPADYLWANAFYPPKRTKSGQPKRFQKGKGKLCGDQGCPQRPRKKARFFCPHCHKALSKIRTLEAFDLYKCTNKHWPYRLDKLSSMKTRAKGGNARKPKLSYLYRDYKVKLEELQSASPAKPKLDLRKSRFSPQVWALALTFTINMGLSLREAAFWMKALFGVEVSHETLNAWMGALAYLLAPFLTSSSEAKVLVGDETQIKVVGEKGYFWVIYDPKKAHLIVSHGAFSKDTTQALPGMVLAFAHNQKVEVFVSDGNPAYQLARNFLITQGVQVPKHVIIPGLKAIPGDKEDKTYRLYKNLIERFCRTFKQRYRRTHGFGSLEGAIPYCTLFALFFNFFRPHQLLGGQCPVEIVTETPFLCEKWALLIQKALDRAVPSA